MRINLHALLHRNYVRLGLYALAVCGFSVGLVANAYASDDFPKAFTTTGGRTVWVAPDAVSKRAVGQAVFNAATGGVNVVETGAVAVRAGASATLTATRFVAAANVARAAGALATGPGALVTALTLAPAIADWIANDQEKKVRIKADRSEVQIRGQVPDYPKSNGYEYRGGYPEFPYRTNPVTACTEDLAHSSAMTGNIQNFIEMEYYGSDGGYAECRFSFAPQYNPSQVSIRTFQLSARNSSGCPKGWYITPNGCIEKPGEAEWLPSTMNDIAPYLVPYPLPATLLPQLLQAGQVIDAQPVNIVGPTALGNGGAPASETTEPVPTPGPQERNTTRSGNPFNLSPNTPTVTGSSAGSTPVNVGGQTVNVPTNSKTTSTFNPGSNTTSSSTVTTTDPVSLKTSTTNNTNITYTTNTATSTTTNTTTTTVINNITNTVINTTTKNDTPTPPDTPPKTEEEKSDLCKENPDILACQTLDTPEGTIPKTQKDIKYEEDNVFGFGSCPSDRYLTLHTGQSLKVTDWAKSCDAISMYYRPLLLVMAAFVAWMILVPGKGAV